MTYYYYANSETGESTWDAPPGFEDLAATASLAADDDDGRVVVGGRADDDDDNDNDKLTMNNEDNNSATIAAIDNAHNSIKRNSSSSSSSSNNTNNISNIDDGEEIGNGWVAYKDDEQRIYYYNNITGETQWDRPGEEEEVKDDDDVDEEKEKLGVDEDDEEEEEDRNDGNNDHGGMFNVNDNVHVDDNNINHHRDNVNQQQLHEEQQQKQLQKEYSSSSASIKTKTAIIIQSEKLLQQPDAIMESNVLSIITTLVSEQGPAIAGPKAIQYLIQGYVGNTAICGVLGQWLARLKSSSLSTSSLATKTMNDNTNNTGKNNNNTNNSNNDNINYCLHESTTNIVRSTATDVITKLAKEHFTKEYGDTIISLNKKDVSFIDTMIHSSRWRQLLIDLSATNMDSKLFMFCLQSISNLGYHRDIANRINPSEFFGVFDSMLQSELIIAGTMAVDGYYCTTATGVKDGVNGGIDTIPTTVATTTTTSQIMTMGTFINDLRRNCTSTSYTYLYAMEVIGTLLTMANKRLLTITTASKDDDDDDDDDNSCSNTNHHHQATTIATSTTTSMTASWFMRAIMKWERLRDEVEDEMLLHPPKTGTTFQRKRRIDMAITISNLYQRKRRRVDPRLIMNVTNANNDDDNINNNNVNNNNHNDYITRCNTLDVAIIQLITKNSLGILIDKEVLNNILKYAYGGSTDRIGDLLLQHTTAIIALLNHLFSPTQRIRQLDTRMKCARLAALAVIAAFRRAAVTTEGGGGVVMPVEVLPRETNNDTDNNDEDGLIQIILKGSQLCEQLENVVSFTVIDSIINNNTNNNNNTVEERSIGRQLSYMCIKHSVISYGFLIWAKVQSSGVDFVETANYTSVSPCILCLTKLICRYHPLSRPTALEIALIFLGHSNRDISSQKMQSIKEQCLRLLLWLSTQGMSLAVLSAIQNRLDKNNKGVGSSCETLDSSLVRYFFMGMIEILSPPFSIAFVRAFGSLLLIGPCVDALQSKLVDVSTRENIAQLVSQFEVGSVLREDDKLLLSKLKSVYG